MKRTDIVIFEITEGYLKVLRGKFLTDQTLQIASLEALRVEQSSPNNLVKLLSSAVTAKDKKSQVAVVIARSQVILKNFSLPSHSKEELQKMISLQMATHVPYAREDIIFDYNVLGQDSAGYAKILSAVVHRDVIDEFLKIFKSTGLTIHQFVLSSSSIVRWFYGQYLEKVKNEDATVGILNIEASKSEFCFARGGQLVYAREIKYGRRDIGADFENLFLKDIFLTLETYLREHAGDIVSKIYLLAPQPIHGLLLEKIHLLKNTGIECLDPDECLLHNKNMTMPKNLPAQKTSLIVCLGAAQESIKPSFNLLPEDVKKSQKLIAQKWQFVKLAALVIFNFVLFFAIFFHAFYKDQARLNDLKHQASQLRIRVDSVKGQTEQLRKIEALVVSNVSAVDIIYGLYEMTPKEVSFQLLFLDKEGNLTIQGIAETRSSVNDFHRSLTASPLFKDTSLQYAAQRRFFEGEITDFKITAAVKRPEEP